MIILSSILFLLIIIILAVIDFQPYNDSTADGSIVIWFTDSSNGKRMFKYLWKQEN